MSERERERESERGSFHDGLRGEETVPGSVWLTILETKREGRDVRQGNYTLFHAWCWLAVSNMKT